MIDTIKLFSGSFHLKPGHKFKTGTITDSNGEIEAEKTFCNLPHFSIDITRDKVLYLQTSLPKLLYGTSLFEVQPTDFEQAVDKIQDKLSEAGVEIADNRLADFQLSRIDLCRNLEVEHSPMDYLVYLSDRYMPRRQKRDISHETLSFRNSDRELTFYNKVREIRQTEKDPRVLKLVQNRPENILRIESRLKKRRVIDKTLQLGKPEVQLSAVFDSGVCRNHLLHEVDSLVASAESQGEFNFHENSLLLQAIAERRKRGVFKEFLAVRGVREFLTDFRGDWGKIREFLEFHYGKSQTYQLVAELKKYRSLLVETAERDLLAEIRQKLVA